MTTTDSSIEGDGTRRDVRDAGMRLQRYLALCGIASRRSCEEWIAAGRVSVNGQTVTRPGTMVRPQVDRVHVDDCDVRPRQRVVLVFHKPRGVLCTARDPEGRPTIFESLPREYQHLNYVGRLDMDTSGLLLLTNDGDLLQRLTRPRYEVEREYRVLVGGLLTSAAARRLVQGVESQGETLVAKRVLSVYPDSHGTWISLVLTEGRNREVRRMFEELGLPVLRLRRERYAFLTLEGLSAGQWRLCSDEEVSRLAGPVPTFF